LNTNIGNFELIHVTDGTFVLDGGAVFGVVPKVIWSKRHPADENNFLRFALNCLIVRSDERTILIETGAGPKLPEEMQELYQTEPALLRNLKRLGFAPEDFDAVINTHLHFDHCGWNTIWHGDRLAPTFPRARYYVQRGEVEHGRRRSERDRTSYRPENYEPLIETGRMELLDGDRELFPGISVRVYAGHTQHLQTVQIRSGGQTACFISDLIPSTYHLRPTWMMSYDLDPLLVIENRHRFYAEAIPQEWLVMFSHDLRVPWAYIQRDEKGKYSYQAPEVMPAARAA
jgi:glyoxylase-like metal-dependent hydrolase (beta-lactamase superfamily II)